MRKIKIIILCLIIVVSCKKKKTFNCNSVKFEIVDYDEFELNNLNIAYDDMGNLNKCAKEMDKPILTIYGGFSIVGDQAGIWRPLADKKINSILREKYLIRYYHVDNPRELPDSISTEKIFDNPRITDSDYSILTEKKIKTIGHYFSAKQINKYLTNSQPLYTITDWKENDLSKPIGYIQENEIEKFKDFLIKGLKNYN